MNGSIRRMTLLGLAAVLVMAGALWAARDDEADWQAADGSFPDHGGCVYVGPNAVPGLVYTAADDFNAMQRRAKESVLALALIPRAQSAPADTKAQTEPSGIVGAAGCAGIDDCIGRVAAAASVPLGPLASDLEFLRRASLDLTGRIPTKDEVVAFINDPSPKKREALVDTLLATSEWADRWAMFYGDLFENTQITPQVNRYPEGRDSFHLFLLESLRENKAYDQLAREMITAEGTSDGRTYPEDYNSFEQFEEITTDLIGNPVVASPVGYVVGGRMIGGPVQDTYDTLGLRTAKHFLGISALDCVLCHDGEGRLEGVSAWGEATTRLQAWGLSAFFSDIPRYQNWKINSRYLPYDPNRRKPAAQRYYTIHDLDIGQEFTWRGDTAGVYLGQTDGGNRPDRLHVERNVEPTYPFAEAVAQTTGTRLREQLAEQLIADPQFARAAANYLWSEFFGRGIVEPPHQFDPARLDPAAPPAEGWDIQPSHPYLLDWLGAQFRENGFDLKWLMKEIVMSDAYRRSSHYDGVYSASYEKYFVRHQLRRLSAEQVLDAIAVATGRPINRLHGSQSIRNLTSAMQLPDVQRVPLGTDRQITEFKTMRRAFTPGDREQTLRTRDASPLQALYLMNSRFVWGRLLPTLPNGTLRESLRMNDEELVSNMFLSVLSRPPTEQEQLVAAGHMTDGRGSRRQRASDLMWALLNKTDFYYNY